MKYLVNRETKEHKVATPLSESIIKGYPDFRDDWQLVEADDDGWIPWSGGECPLPDDQKYDVKSARYRRPLLGFDEPQTNYWRQDGDIIAYRPILSETAENGEASSRMEAPALAPQSAFIRLRQAVEAAESLPAIIAEIDALLPDGYCVTRCVEQPAEDMGDWQNWREGDILECIRPTGFHTKGRLYRIGRDGDGEYGILDDDGDVLGRYTPKNECFTGSYFRFDSRPAKETDNANN